MCPFFLTRILSIPSFFGSKVVADKIYPNFRNLKISCWSAAPLLQIRNERIGQKTELLSIIERKKKGSLKCQYIHIFLRKLFPLYLSWYICRLHIPSLTLVPPLMANLAKRLHFFNKTIKKIPSEMEVAPRYNYWHCWHCWNCWDSWHCWHCWHDV